MKNCLSADRDRKKKKKRGMKRNTTALLYHLEGYVPNEKGMKLTIIINNTTIDSLR